MLYSCLATVGVKGLIILSFHMFREQIKSLWLWYKMNRCTVKRQTLLSYRIVLSASPVNTVSKQVSAMHLRQFEQHSYTHDAVQRSVSISETTYTLSIANALSSLVYTFQTLYDSPTRHMIHNDSLVAWSIATRRLGSLEFTRLPAISWTSMRA